MKIEYGNDCFGEIVIIDGFNIIGESNTESSIAKDKVLEELKLAKDKLSLYDWKIIVEILTNSDKSFKYDLEDSSMDSCDQCGNYNEYSIYEK